MYGFGLASSWVFSVYKLELGKMGNRTSHDGVGPECTRTDVRGKLLVADNIARRSISQLSLSVYFCSTIRLISRRVIF